MSSGNDHTGLVSFIIAAPKNFPDPAVFHLLCHTEQIQSQAGLTTHRINIGDRIRRSDLAKHIRIVHDRRKKVYRLNQGSLFVDHIDTGVITFIKSHDQAGIRMRFKVLQQSG